MQIQYFCNNIDNYSIPFKVQFDDDFMKIKIAIAEIKYSLKLCFRVLILKLFAIFPS